MNSVVQAQQLGLVRDGRALLQDIGLAMQAGELLGIIGPNGAGKSTLLRLLAGIETPSSGAVLLHDQPLSAMSANERARHIAWLEQRPALHWPLPAREVVALGALPFRHSENKAALAQRVARALRESGTEALAGRRVDTLSEGEKLLVHLARILAVESGVILVDEPTSALDPRHQLRIMQVLGARAKAGVAVGAVLHDLGLAWRHCDRLLLLHEGRCLALGKPEDVLQPALLQQAFGLPVDIDAARRQLQFLPGPDGDALTR